MSGNQSLAIGWLVGRLEWEGTLAELHARARLTDPTEPVSPSPAAQPVNADSPEPARPPKVRWSPIRGMSRRRPARKIRA